jgi:transcriptional antiterminator RfaH
MAFEDCDNPRDRRWFAVKAQPGREALALVHLQRQGFETYLPLMAQGLPTSSRGPNRPKPFFPGYLFVRLCLDTDRWLSVNGTRGVARIVQLGDRPTPVPRGLVEQMQRLTAGEGTLGFSEPLFPGDPIRVVGGAFDDAIGVFQRVSARERVTVLLSLMQRQIEVSLPSRVVKREARGA